MFEFELNIFGISSATVGFSKSIHKLHITTGRESETSLYLSGFSHHPRRALMFVTRLQCAFSDLSPQIDVLRQLLIAEHRQRWPGFRQSHGAQHLQVC